MEHLTDERKEQLIARHTISIPSIWPLDLRYELQDSDDFNAIAAQAFAYVKTCKLLPRTTAGHQAQLHLLQAFISTTATFWVPIFTHYLIDAEQAAYFSTRIACSILESSTSIADGEIFRSFFSEKWSVQPARIPLPPIAAAKSPWNIAGYLEECVPNWRDTKLRIAAIVNDPLMRSRPKPVWAAILSSSFAPTAVPLEPGELDVIHDQSLPGKERIGAHLRLLDVNNSSLFPAASRPSWRKEGRLSTLMPAPASSQGSSRNSSAASTPQRRRGSPREDALASASQPPLKKLKGFIAFGPPSQDPDISVQGLAVTLETEPSEEPGEFHLLRPMTPSPTLARALFHQMTIESPVKTEEEQREEGELPEDDDENEGADGNIHPPAPPRDPPPPPPRDPAAGDAHRVLQPQQMPTHDQPPAQQENRDDVRETQANEGNTTVSDATEQEDVAVQQRDIQQENVSEEPPIVQIPQEIVTEQHEEEQTKIDDVNEEDGDDNDKEELHADAEEEQTVVEEETAAQEEEIVSEEQEEETADTEVATARVEITETLEPPPEVPVITEEEQQPDIQTATEEQPAPPATVQPQQPPKDLQPQEQPPSAQQPQTQLPSTPQPPAQQPAIPQLLGTTPLLHQPAATQDTPQQLNVNTPDVLPADLQPPRPAQPLPPPEVLFSRTAAPAAPVVPLAAPTAPAQPPKPPAGKRTLSSILHRTPLFHAFNAKMNQSPPRPMKAKPGRIVFDSPEDPIIRITPVEKKPLFTANLRARKTSTVAKKTEAPRVISPILNPKLASPVNSTRSLIIDGQCITLDAGKDFDDEFDESQIPSPVAKPPASVNKSDPPIPSLMSRICSPDRHRRSDLRRSGRNTQPAPVYRPIAPRRPRNAQRSINF